ncbi:MAG TPA: M20/M25/M40 family metallo-hydrolase [Gemmatimonas sp.]|nr:M20/M25/M40 family metallo-hydrolase [Gemmatimonas sp.]
MRSSQLPSRPAGRRFATRPATVAAAIITGLPLLVHAQRPGAPRPATAGNPVTAIAAKPAVRQALDALQRDNAWTIDQQVSLCEIPAPPFKEAVRAAAFRDRLTALGLTSVRIDGEGNVIGEIRGSVPGPTVLISGHLDTVFPEGTDVKVKRTGTRLSGPGIGDDCRGLAVVLAMARQIIATKIAFPGRVLVVGTVGEEGAGNLRGVRALFASPLKDSIGTFISVDGTGYGITNGGVGSNRYRVTYSGPGGHSYGAFGMPNPIHAMGRAIGLVADLQVPATPKVTFNVGIVSGGTSVNSISASASMDVDLRSESASALATTDAQLQKAFAKALAAERARWPQSKVPLTMKIDTIGIRPAGSTSDTTFVVRTAKHAADAMGIYAPLTISSTDANIPMALGIPSITVDGGGIGSNSHSLDEWYDDRTDGYKGPQWVMLLVLGLLGVR